MLLEISQLEIPKVLALLGRLRTSDRQGCAFGSDYIGTRLTKPRLGDHLVTRPHYFEYSVHNFRDSVSQGRTFRATFCEAIARCCVKLSLETFLIFLLFLQRSIVFPRGIRLVGAYLGDILK